MRHILIAATAAAALTAGAASSSERPQLMFDEIADAAAEGERAQIAWDLTSLFPDVDAWDAARQELLADIPPLALAATQARFAESAEGMAEVLDRLSAITLRAYRVFNYASLSADEDLRDAEAQERRALARRMASELGEAVAWLDPAVLALGAETVEAYIAAEPLLAKHAFSLRDKLARAPHTLSPESERLMAAVGLPLGGPQNVYSQMMNSDIPWPTITLSTGEEVRLDSQGYSKHRAAPNRDDRIAVFDAFYATFDQFESALGATLAAHVQGQVFRAEQRAYPDAVTAALASEQIPLAVYDTLVAEVNAGLPTLHRYMRLRARMMGLEQAAYHDIYPDLVATDDTFPLERAKEITIASSAPLGEDYLGLLRPALEERWMHVYPSEGKRSGAYMSGSVYDAHPFVLLNHQDDFGSASTFAHEWGHAIHTLLANQAQPFETAGYSIFLAEAAAIMLEVLAQDHMLKNAENDDERLYFLGYALEQMRGTFFRQTQFAEFERAIHTEIEEGRALTGARLTEMYDDIVKRYYGHAEGATEVPDAYALEWAYIPHFYYNFYVYQYATSMAGAVDFAEKILSGDERAREAYLDMLRAGGSDHPYELMKTAGVDLASPEPYRAVVRRMDAIMDEIEAILDARGE